MYNKESIIKKSRSAKTDLHSFGVKQFGLFGSYSRNAQTELSDIDVLIDFEPEQENFDNLMAACDLLQSLFDRARIEVVTKNGLSPHIGPSILKEIQYV